MLAEMTQATSFVKSSPPYKLEPSGMIPSTILSTKIQPPLTR